MEERRGEAEDIKSYYSLAATTRFHRPDLLSHIEDEEDADEESNEISPPVPLNPPTNLFSGLFPPLSFF